MRENTIVRSFRISREADQMLNAVSRKYGWKKSDILNDLLINGLRPLYVAEFDPTQMIAEAVKQAGVMLHDIGETIEVTGNEKKKRKSK